MQRAIHIFPNLKNMEAIQSLRSKYDPLCHLIPPHITLVHPFESHIPTAELLNHVQNCTRRVTPFEVVLSGVTGTSDGYLFLNVKHGNDCIIALHDSLYSGILLPFLFREVTYTPHITVGQLSDSNLFRAAITETEAFSDKFQALVEEIIIETIEPSGQSTVEHKVRLG